MLYLFAATLFLSAALLFSVQPMFAKMALPLLGGTPGVWNTCMVFYQAALLAGYAYAHFSIRRLRPGGQLTLHAVLLALPWLALPIGVAAAWTPPPDANPIPWLWMLLAVSIGLPFVAVGASSPLLQAWFAASGHRKAQDPYFLYAASNLGSLTALLAYPVLIEPFLPLRVQSLAWAVGFGLLTALAAGCAWARLRAAKEPGSSPEDADTVLTEPPDGDARSVPPSLEKKTPTFATRFRWIALAAVPSSLLLGLTTFVTTDIASAPLFWIVPFALYLLSFVFVFARRQILPHRWMLVLQPILLAILAAAFFTSEGRVSWMVLPLHLAAFFATCMVCHGELAAARPSPEFLTEFYFWMSFGGVLGGLFNAMIAPMFFSRPMEYPLMLVVACLLRPNTAIPTFRRRSGRTPAVLDAAVPAILAFGMFGLITSMEASGLDELIADALGKLEVAPGVMGVGAVAPAIAISLGAVVAISAMARPVRFALSIAAILLMAGFQFNHHSLELVRAERSFFGLARVWRNARENANVLVHGSIYHGSQCFEPDRREEPLSYYFRTGPVGQFFNALGGNRLKTVGVVGLGSGTIAAYASPGQSYVFFEIDPAIAQIAEDPNCFTYLADARKRGAQVDVVLGDARLTLAGMEKTRFDLLVIDAYSSDAIPLHLMTREAMRLYLDRLAPDGVLAFHISNRYFNLAPVLGRLARDAELLARVQHDSVEGDEGVLGKLPSTWVTVARGELALGSLAKDKRWRDIPASDTPLWTDDFSNLLSTLSWH